MNFTGLVKNPVLLALAACGVAAASGLAFLTHAPNRLVSGSAISLAQAVTAGDGLSTALALAATLGSALPLVAGIFMRPRRVVHFWIAVAAAALLAALIGIAGGHAARLAFVAADSAGGESSGIARTSLGGAFWILAALTWLAAGDAIRRLGLTPGWRFATNAVVIAPVLALLATGALDWLSPLREYANRKDVFNAALLRHAQLVAASLAPALAIGVPLGVAAVRNGKFISAVRPALFATLNVIQTIPSIALFGLLMAPLALLAASTPALARWGVQGIGMAPAVIALALYSLLPVVRGTAAGLTQVPRPIVDAAVGMGMSPRQVFWRVEVPLALPVLIAGLRVATVQAIGMAVVAALIGAGGFGAILFQGLLGGALDLALLGVVPVVAMALLADALLQTLAMALAHGNADPVQ